jgi:hypothetical protein
VEIELEGIRLVWIQQNEDPARGPVQIRQISDIVTSDKRTLVEHQIPGLEGNLFQNLGRAPVKISLRGNFQGEGSKEELTRIRQKFKDGNPCSFNSDVTGISDVTRVLIEELQIYERSGEPNRFEYAIVLREFREPPPEPAVPPSQDAAAEEWAEDQAGDAMGSINTIVGRVLDLDGNPKQGAPVLITGQDGEYRVETDEQGMYRLEDLAPGRYSITVGQEGYEGVTREVEVGGTPGEQPSGESEPGA